MSGVDVPHLIHEQQMAGPKYPEGFKPPSYHTNGGSNVAGPAGNGSGVGEEGGGNVHNHFYQVQSEDREPPRKSYPPKHMCIYICLLVATIIILMAIAVGVALAIILTNRSNNDEPSSPANPSPDDNNLPSVSILTKTTVVEVEVTSPSEPSLVTATMTVTYEPGTSVVTETQIQTYTAEPPPRIETSDANDDDVEDMLSSLLEQRPLISTQYVTISPSEEHTSPTTSSTTTSSTTSSMTSSTSTTATTATTSTATSSASAALSTLSRISALDINSGSRRYIFWQDTDKHLVTSQFGGRRNETYRIVDKITDVGGEKPAQPKHGTPLAAADDETGALHVFYLGAKDNAIHQLTRLADGDWMATQVLHRGDALRAAPNSALSATWHRSDQFDGTRSRLVALAWQDDHLRVKTVMTEDPTDPDGWSISDLNTRMGVDVGRGARDDRGIAVSSGNLDGETLDRRASLFVAVEGDDAVMLWNCSVGANGFPLHIERCDWLNDTWSNPSSNIKPISPPLKLEWLTSSTAGRSLPVVHGLLSLNRRGDVLESSWIDAREGLYQRRYGINDGIVDFAASSDTDVFVATNKQVFEYHIGEGRDAEYVGRVVGGGVGGAGGRGGNRTGPSW